MTKKKPLSYFCLFIVSIFITSCGIKFVDRIPASGDRIAKEWENRVIFKGGGSWISNLGQLPGYLLYYYATEDSSLDYDLLPQYFVSSNAEPIVNDQPVERYNGIIKGSDAADLSYLVGKIGISKDHVTELIITDVSQIQIDRDDIPPYDSIATRTRIPAKTVAVYYIKGVVLSSIVHKTYTQRKSSGAITGTAFGAEGSTFASAEDFSVDYKIGIDYLNITHYFDSLSEELDQTFTNDYIREISAEYPLENLNEKFRKFMKAKE